MERHHTQPLRRQLAVSVIRFLDTHGFAPRRTAIPLQLLLYILHQSTGDGTLLSQSEYDRIDPKSERSMAKPAYEQV
jgi:hypothetical protein